MKQEQQPSLFIRNFKQISVFIIKLCVVMGVLFALFCMISPQYLYSYNASLIDKIDRLEAINEPKIVLVGNSNLAFGINSEEIEEAFGMPVVNLGLNSELGNPFLEEMAKLNVNEGDIYILCHTNYADDDTIGVPSVWVTLEDHFHLWKILRGKDVIPMLQGFPTYVKGCMELWEEERGNRSGENAYNRVAFNEYGDVAYERKEPKKEIDIREVKVPEIADITADRINELNQYMEDRGATLLIAGYPIMVGEGTPPEEEYVNFQKQLEDAMDAEVISDFTDYMIEYRYFYDTIYHLTDEGVEIRTRQLISDLNTYLEQREDEIG